MKGIGFLGCTPFRIPNQQLWSWALSLSPASTSSGSTFPNVENGTPRNRKGKGTNNHVQVSRKLLGVPVPVVSFSGLV